MMCALVVPLIKKHLGAPSGVTFLALRRTTALANLCDPLWKCVTNNDEEETLDVLQEMLRCTP